jgi:transketolase
VCVFGDSGAPWELIKAFGVSAEHIAARARELMKIKIARVLEQEEHTLEQALATSH